MAVISSHQQDDCDLRTVVPVRSDASGGFAADLDVRTVISTAGGHEVVCIDENCVIVAAYTANLEVSASQPIEWSPDAAAPEAPTLTITALRFDEGATTGAAEVTGAGFVPGSRVELVQCPLGSAGREVSQTDCLYDIGTSATADARGEIAVRALIVRRFQRSSGAHVDCVAAPSRCAIADPFSPGQVNRPSSVTFDTAP